MRPCNQPKLNTHLSHTLETETLEAMVVLDIPEDGLWNLPNGHQEAGEDITKATWVAKSSLPPFLKNTSPSIIEVFREARI